MERQKTLEVANEQSKEKEREKAGASERRQGEGHEENK